MQEAVRRLVRGELRTGELPETISVWDLEEAYGELRDNTRDQGVEWGGCIWSGEDRLYFQHTTRGEADKIVPLCPCPYRAGYAGFAHTHLPDRSTKQPYIGFSDLDYVAAIAEGSRLELVTNGEGVYALVRTADCTLERQIVADGMAKDWAREYEAAKARASKTGNLDDELWKVNREICEQLGLAFYKGLWGQPLVRVYQPRPGRTI